MTSSLPRVIAVLCAVALAGCPSPEPPADDDDVTEEGWDPSPPDVPDGTRLYATLSCAVFAGPTDKAWQHQEDRWIEIPGFEGDLLEDLQPCLTQGPRELVWDGAPSIVFVAGGWEHRLGPTDIEDRWFGEAEPAEPPEQPCLDALAGQGMELPVLLEMRVTGVEVP